MLYLHLNNNGCNTQNEILQDDSRRYMPTMLGSQLLHVNPILLTTRLPIEATLTAENTQPQAHEVAAFKVI